MNAIPEYVFHKASLPGVTIIEPTSPEFYSAVASIVHPAVLSGIQPWLPFSYVLLDSDRHRRKGHNAGLQLVEPFYVARRRRHRARGEQTGFANLRLGVPNVGPTGNGLARQLQRILESCPSHYGHRNQRIVVARAPTPAGSRIVSTPCLTNDRSCWDSLLAAFNSKAKVETTVETVIFDDGRAFGPDATNATGQAQAYLDAQREVANALASPNAAQILAEMAAGPRSYVMSNPVQYHESLAYYRKTSASLLLALMQSQLADIASRLDQIQENVAQKRSLNIVRQ